MKVHGDFSVTQQGSIIVCVVAGSFNEDGVIAYTQRVKAIVEQLNHMPFSMLIDDLDFEGATPEGFSVLEEYNHWLLSQAIVAKAMIVTSLAHKEIILQQSPSISKQNVEFFTERNSAIAWLQQQLRYATKSAT